MCRNLNVLLKRYSLKDLAVVAAFCAARDKGGRTDLPATGKYADLIVLATGVDDWEVSGTRARSEAAETLSSLTTPEVPVASLAH